MTLASGKRVSANEVSAWSFWDASFPVGYATNDAEKRHVSEGGAGLYNQHTLGILDGGLEIDVAGDLVRRAIQQYIAAVLKVEYDQTSILDNSVLNLLME